MNAAVPLTAITGALGRAGLLVSAPEGEPAAVSSITDDSRAARPGGLFLAVRGSERDGHDFIQQALGAGSAAIMVEDAARASGPAIVVRDSRRAAAIAAAAFYGEPARGMRLIGVTGTNGKTTTVGMLRHLLETDGARSASIGTLGVLVGSKGERFPGGGGLTTPGAVELQRLLRELSGLSVRTVAMEVSSHSLHQRRIEGIQYDVAVFTNLTRDHLDYHGTMEAYLEAKASLLEYLSPAGTGVRNADDRAWSALTGASRWISFGERAAADVTARDVRYTPRGSSWTLSGFGQSHPVRLPLIGDFNVTNALGAAAAACATGLSLETIATRLSTMPQVPGRLELLSENPAVLRDYAHTPDALERALKALRPFTTGKLIVVFGAGGDRDRGKRPLMGKVGDAHADLIVVTSDNPRTEDPERIIDEIVAPLAVGRYERVEDRRSAIARAIELADPVHDVVLLAGKGHEDYQVRGTEKLPFDEREVVRGILRDRGLHGARA